MKKLITTLAITAVCVGAFAQGKVAFVNDSLHAYYMAPAGDPLVVVKQADDALAGLRTPVGGLLPSGVSLRADLWAGTSADSLTLISSTTMSGSIAGRQLTSNVTLPLGIPGGVAQYFQVQIRDSLFATAHDAEIGGSYFGYGTIFTTVPGSGAGYNSIISTIAPALSTWAIGNYNLGASGWGAIKVGAIVPEPTSMVLAGLGAASLLLFRRASTSAISSSGRKAAGTIADRSR
jgi:hypothetical protein